MKACFLCGTKLTRQGSRVTRYDANYERLVTQETKEEHDKVYKLTCSVRVVSIQRPEVVICEKENRTTSVISIYNTLVAVFSLSNDATDSYKDNLE